MILRILPLISSTLVFLPAILAIAYYKRSPSRFFNWYIFGCVITELVLWYMTNHKMYTWWVTYLFILFELLFLGLTFYDFVKATKLGRYILWGTWSVFALSVIFYLINYRFLMHQIQNTFLILISGAYLVDYIRNDQQFELWSSSRLWIGFGVFFYFFSCALVFTLIPAIVLEGNKEFDVIYTTVNAIVTALSYLIFSYGLFVGRK